jgi:hypothetical protein
LIDNPRSCGIDRQARVRTCEVPANRCDDPFG